MTAEDHIRSLPKIRRQDTNRNRGRIWRLMPVLMVVQCLVLILVAAIGIMSKRTAPDAVLSDISAWETPLGGLSISDGQLLTTYEQSSHPDRLDIDDVIEVSGSAVASDGAVSVPAATVETPDMILEAPILAVSPEVSLEKGDYTLSLNYNASVDQYAVLVVDGTDLSGAIKLSKNRSSVSYHFALPKVSTVRVAVTYGFYGDMTLIGGGLSRNMNGTKRTMAALLFVFIAADILLINRRRFGSERTAVAGIVFTFILSILPLFAKGIPLGHDLHFHLMRIDGLATELSYGQFPVRMQSLWMDGFSYPVSVLYGDLFLYIPAILRLCGYSVIGAYQIYIALMDLALTIVTYVCMRKIFGSDLAAFAATAGYVLSAYRIVDVYARAAVGEATAYLALPVIALAVHRMYADEESDDADNGLLLAVGMSILFFTHNLSVLMTSAFLLVVALIFVKKTFTAKNILAWIIAILSTVALAAVYIVPMLDYTLRADLNSAVNADETLIQWGGTYIYQYFMVFSDYFGFNSVNLSERFNLSPGLILMIGFVAVVVHIILGHASRRTKYMTVLSCIALLLASNLFPWDILSGRVSTQFAMIQFPWRFLPIASVCLAVLLGSLIVTVIEHAKKRRMETLVMRGMGAFFAVCAAVSGAVYAYQTFSRDYIASYRDIDEVDHYCVTSFFLRNGVADDEPLSLSMVGHDGMERAELIARAGTTAIYEVAAETEGEPYFEAPVFNYPYYEAHTGEGEALEITDGTKKLIRVYVPAGFTGRAVIDFKPPAAWHVAEAVSSAAWLALALRCGHKRRKTI